MILLPVQTKKILSSIEPNEQIGLIKLDAEGYELNILNSIKNFIVQQQPVIFFKCTKEMDFIEIATLFDTIGYDIFEINEEKKSLNKANDKFNKITSFLAKPK